SGGKPRVRRSCCANAAAGMTAGMSFNKSRRFIDGQCITATLQAMGFALFASDEQLWAKGTHEYRPMGVAVIAGSSVFTPRDFHRRRPSPRAAEARFIGFFASLGDINGFLLKHRSQHSRIFRKRKPSRVISIL